MVRGIRANNETMLKPMHQLISHSVKSEQKSCLLDLEYARICVLSLDIRGLILRHIYPDSEYRWITPFLFRMKSIFEVMSHAKNLQKI